ncbi:MAG: BadF/BadG/BcrA/BcrD ATPase family protein, partial [Victivallales bacterium]
KAAKEALEGVSADELHVVNLHQVISPIQDMGIPQSCRISVFLAQEHTGALALVGEEYGLVIVAGTGSHVFGRNREGRRMRIDGLGPVLGDVGSGYHIGYLGLRAAARGIWHTRHATSLTGKIFDACCKIPDEGNTTAAGTAAKEPASGTISKSIDKPFPECNATPLEIQLREVVKFSLRNNDRSVIASLAGIVDAEAGAGDAVATNIILYAASQMAENIRDLTDNLQIGGDRYVMVGTGSVSMKSDLYWEHLCKLVKVFAPGLEPMRSPLPPVAGLGLLGLLRLEGIDRFKVRSALFNSVREYLLRIN